MQLSNSRCLHVQASRKPTHPLGYAARRSHRGGRLSSRHVLVRCRPPPRDFPADDITSADAEAELYRANPSLAPGAFPITPPIGVYDEEPNWRGAPLDDNLPTASLGDTTPGPTDPPPNVAYVYYAAPGEELTPDFTYGMVPAPASTPASNPGAQQQPARLPYVPSGAPETSWYCWPEGYIGQSFSLSGKLQPRASPLLEDVDKLSEFTVRRREQCRYTEHTIDSAESASQMVQAVVGGSVDMGLFNASGNASLDMSREFSSRSVSHTLVASFQENELLEMVRPSLSEQAKSALENEGPAVFAVKYGTHFVSGVGHRGAFVGTITVKLQDMKLAAGASASFKASYGKVSGMASLKAKMEESLKTSDVVFRWHKWGVEDDSSLDELEEYCGKDDAQFAGMRVLAMHTADQAVGYPKLIKLRPYSTLPDYVEACSRYCMDNPRPPVDIELQDIEQALSYLTKQYRKASYINQVLENDERLNVINPFSLSAKGSLAYKVKVLLKLMEEMFRTKPVEKPVFGSLGYRMPPLNEAELKAAPSLYQLSMHFKYATDPDMMTPSRQNYNPDIHVPLKLGQALKQQLDEVDRLNYYLFKTVQRPLVNPPYSPNQAKLTDDQIRNEVSVKLVHIAVACDASPEAPFGRWYLDYQEMETFTKRGLYCVRLARKNSYPVPGLQQVGKTQFWDVGVLGIASAFPGGDWERDVGRYISEAKSQQNLGVALQDNVFLLFTVGVSTFLPAMDGATWKGIWASAGLSLYGVAATYPSPQQQPGPSIAFGSWAAILFANEQKTYINSGSLQYKPEDAVQLLEAANNSRAGGKLLSTLTNPGLAFPPMGMVLAEQLIPVYK